MIKNIQITTLGGYINENYPHLYLHGVKNAVRDILGLDYAMDIKEKNGIINYKKEKKEMVKFTFNIPYDEFRESMISHEVELSFLIYNTYPDFKDTEKISAQHFNGYITKIKKDNQNTYSIEVLRTTKIYKIDLLNGYWINIDKYHNRQTAFEKLEQYFMKPTKLEYNSEYLYPYIEKSEEKDIVRFKPLNDKEISYITIHNTSDKQNNIVSFTDKKIDEVKGIYSNLIAEELDKDIDNWTTNIFYNLQQVKGLYIENNKLKEHTQANVLKIITKYNSKKHLDIFTFDKNQSTIYCLNFKEIEIC